MINGIPILVHRPDGLLQAFQASLASALAAFEQEKLLLHGQPSRDTSSRAAHPRIERILSGKTGNLSLLDRCMQPVREYLYGRTRLPAVADLVATTVAHRAPYWWMLSYFYQDWGGTRDFDEVASLITNALLRLRPDGEALAVLGAGAGGLVRRGAQEFDRTYGVDLSAPTLLLAHEVLAGQSLDVFLETADWAHVRLTSPVERLHRNIELAVADVNWLPLAANSMSAVITQYLMDVLADPLHVASEIRRVLKPGGIWINFSVPFQPLHEPTALGRPDISEIAGLLHPLGLTVEESERRQFRWLNTDKISPLGHRYVNDVHYFAARKDAATIADQLAPGGPKLDWEWIPRRAPSRDVHFVNKRIPRGDQIDTASEAQIPLRGSLSMPAPALKIFEQLVMLVDGRRTAGDIFGALPAGNGWIDREMFLDVLPYLVRHHGLLCSQAHTVR
jgi:ubiquinone/menaquinone biosynthesis C-methylase UbiE